jgi:hypothetical protein
LSDAYLKRFNIKEREERNSDRRDKRRDGKLIWQKQGEEAEAIKG